MCHCEVRGTSSFSLIPVTRGPSHHYPYSKMQDPLVSQCSWSPRKPLIHLKSFSVLLNRKISWAFFRATDLWIWVWFVYPQQSLHQVSNKWTSAKFPWWHLCCASPLPLQGHVTYPRRSCGNYLEVVKGSLLLPHQGSSGGLFLGGVLKLLSPPISISPGFYQFPYNKRERKYWKSGQPNIWGWSTSVPLPPTPRAKLIISVSFPFHVCAIF